MNKQHIRIRDYVEGKLSAEASREAEAHLLDCSRCRQAVEELQQRRTAGRKGGGPGRILSRFIGGLLRGELIIVDPLLERLRLVRPFGPPKAATSDEPLRVLRPIVLSGVSRLWRFIGRFGLVLSLTAGVLLLPRPEGLSAAGQRGLAAFVFTAGVLALEPVSLPIAALMVPVALVALRVADTSQAFETFSRPVVFLILASLFLAEALRKHGLTRRLALLAIVASGGGTGALLLGLMSISALFSMWVGNTATAAMLIPVALTISREVSDRDEAADLLTLLALGIAYSASLGGMVTILGAAANAVASGFLSKIMPWTFLDWLKYGLPAFVVIFPLTWLLLFKLMPVAITRLDVSPARGQVRDMGPMNRVEREILIMLVVTACLWIGGPFLEASLGLPPTLFSAALVAVMAVCYLAIREIIDWEDLKGISWGIFLIIGAGLSLGEALVRSGATDWFALLIAPLVTGSSLFISLILLVTVSALLTNLLNNTTIAAVFVPVLITLAADQPALNPLMLVLPVTLATTFGYSLPSASGRMALLAATGIVPRGTMLRCGLVITLASSLALAVLFYLLAGIGWFG
ncbi:sodium-anion symporter [Syntrophotalea acetylenivorans]|uniref:Sodium-anion symporter n=1 Tax=Syntrophotalea acetylenivorans TaxID=1842532 RepID=A0A1L3GPL4_9BACT|nr:DASS family sodium-coupled anion symporter [Syntrophotalea acetylenivorans]APG27854.1 sodium-anion symporter [Syntrophotalea acetylenivorans]